MRVTVCVLRTYVWTDGQTDGWMDFVFNHNNDALFLSNNLMKEEGQHPSPHSKSP